VEERKDGLDMTPVLGIVFSRDRAMQLDATLRSFHLHCQDPTEVTLYVIYKATDLRNARQYAQLELEYAAYGYVHFIEETDFRHHVLRLVVTHWASDVVGYVLFLVDDNLFVRDFSLGEVREALAQHPEALGFSLRLGGNISYLYTGDRAQVPPTPTPVGGEVRMYDWTAARQDFAYGLELSSSVYRIDEMADLMIDLSFANPNTLEAWMAANQHRFRATSPCLLCYERSVAFCSPVNKVQTVYGNRVGARPEYSAGRLAELFAQGYRIQVEAYDGFVPCSVQQEVELVFEKRNLEGRRP
jgi:hypothetical protein